MTDALSKWTKPINRPGLAYAERVRGKSDIFEFISKWISLAEAAFDLLGKSEIAMSLCVRLERWLEQPPNGIGHFLMPSL